ncbi:MAG: hypothetical protein ACTHU0_27905 [Kofleriaceae bacterium]
MNYLSSPSAAVAARMMTIGRPLDDGWVLSSQDYKAGELVTWAQVCLWTVGKSDLAFALLNQIDPHAAFAAMMLGIDLKDFDKKIKAHGDLRQAAKPWNFSKPGGGGVPTIVMQARKQGEDTPHPDGPSTIDDGSGNPIPGFKGLRFCTIMQGAYCGGRDGKAKRRTWGSRGRERPITPTCALCLELGQQLEATWRRKWSESTKYHDYTSRCVEHGMVITPEMLERWPWWQEVFRPGQQLDPMQIAQFFSGRIRKVGATAETPFCVISNTLFQGLLADIAKLAQRICVRECYDRTIRVPDMLFHNSRRSRFAGMESPLVGSKNPAFQHDELIAEHPRSVGHEAAWRISEVMEDCMRYICPDLADAAEVKPTLMDAWFKGAEMVVHNGRLVPWTPEHNPKKCGECAAERARAAA